MDVIARECAYVTGRSPEYGGAGDSSILTAFGVFQGMRAAVRHRYGTTSLAGKRVGIEGVGKVGARLVDHLIEEGAEVVICDVNEQAIDRVRRRHPAVEVVGDAAELITADLDIYAPCALGGSLNDETAPRLRAKIVCGAANNQLAHPGVEKQLSERGILYAPDYVVNAGGVIQVAAEIHGFDMARARAKASKIFDT